MAVPVHHRGRTGKWVGLLAYNSGRIMSYAVLGLAAGSAGVILQNTDWQRGLSVIAGLFLIGMVAYSSNWINRQLSPSFMRSGINWLRASLGIFLKRKDYPSLITLGILNGLLPCGMVYVALVASAAAGGWGASALYMVFYGLGTLPAMMAVGLAGQWLSLSWRAKFRKMVPVSIVVVGIVLLVRGIYPMTDHTMHSHTAEKIPVCSGK